MEQQESTSATPVTTRSAGIRYGVIGGIVSIIMFLIFMMSGIDITTSPLRWLGYLITIILIVLAHKYYKDNGDSFMSYPQGIGIAFWFGLISGLISSVFTYIYVKFIDGTFLQTIKDKQIEQMEERGMSDEQIEQAMKFASMFTSAEMILVFGFIGAIIAAVIIGLIVTIFTQKKNPDPVF